MKDFYQAIVNDNPKLKAGVVYCHTCGHTYNVDSAECLRVGWPSHCGYTMSLDKPN